MSVIHNIPNQPFQFEADTQGCKNKDTQVYGALAQENDTICVQWRQDPQTTTELNNDDLYTTFPLLNGTTEDFSVDTNWTKGTGWTISGGKANHAAGVSSDIYQSLAMRTGYSFIVTYTVSNRTAGTVNLFTGVSTGSVSGTSRSTNATFTETIAFSDISTDNRFGFSASSTFDGSIDNVSIIAIPYANTGTGATYWTTTSTVTDPITHVVGSNKPLVSSGLGLTAGHYAIEFTITDCTVGTITPTVSGIACTASSGNGTFRRYATVVGGSGDIILLPSSTFDGAVSGVVIYKYNTDHNCYILNSSSTKITKAYDINDAQYPLVYDDDRVTWCFIFSNIKDVSNVAIDPSDGCYYIRITDDTDATDFDSVNIINYKSAWDCTQMVIADNNNTYAFGFNWTTFTLRQRLRTLRIVPKYPSSSDNYVYSTGTHRRNFAQSEKIWTWWIDKVDEITHDAIRLQLLSDTLTLDGVEYFAPSDNYEPEWAENMKRNLARARVDLQKITDVLYNRNCS